VYQARGGQKGRITPILPFVLPAGGILPAYPYCTLPEEESIDNCQFWKN
jgi:hypothetical protein